MVLAVSSGFILTRPHAPSEELIATSLLIDAALAPVTVMLARERGRSTLRWCLFGAALGMWALAAAFFVWERERLRARHPLNDSPGPRDAA
jgi:hypothetical protein